MKNCADVYLVGLGMHLGHLTRDGGAALNLCGTRYFMHSDPEVRRYIEELPGVAIDISSFYVENESRMTAYRRIAAAVLDSALSDAPVCVALYGHPLFLSTISQMVLDGADWLKLEVIIVPGVSSVDTVTSDLRIDPGQVSLQLQEATNMLLYRAAIDSCRGLLILQPAQFGTALQSTASSRGTRFAPLLHYLLVFYPVDHPAYVVTSAQTSHGPVRVDKVLLNPDLDLSEAIRADSSLYVPPVVAGANEDDAIRKGLNDESWLNEIADIDADDQIH